MFRDYNKTYNFLISSRRLNANAVLAEEIKKSEHPVIIITSKGSMTGEQWLEKFYKGELE